MNIRDTIIEKIRKLRRMTESGGASENEAAMAARAVAKLIAEYAIDETELSLRADAVGMVCDFYSMPGSRTFFHDYVVKAIRRLTSTRGYRDERFEDPLDMGMADTWSYVYFFGYPLDVEAAITLSAICQCGIVTELERFAKANRKLATKVGRQSFHLGICERLSIIIDELRPKAVAGSVGTGSSLVVLKDSLVSDNWARYREAQGLRLSAGSAGDTRIDPAALRAGRDSASRIDLGRSTRVGSSNTAMQRLT